IPDAFVVASLFSGGRRVARDTRARSSPALTGPRRYREELAMKVYPGKDVRNVAVVGHAHSGKTTLIAALLQAAKMTPVQGRVDDGSAVTAYDEEEVARRTTMANAVAFAEWNGTKINFVDTPGFHM